MFAVSTAAMLSLSDCKHAASLFEMLSAKRPFDGETVSLDDLRGKGVVLNFGASLCGKRQQAVALQKGPKLTVRTQRLTSGCYLAAFWAAGRASG